MLRRLSIALPAALVLLASCGEPTTPEPVVGLFERTELAPLVLPGSRARVIPDKYIVVFNDDTRDVKQLAARLVAQHRGTLELTYQHALRGFAASLSPRAVEALRRHPAVKFIEADQVGELTGVQFNPPWGLDRIDQRGGMDGAFFYGFNGQGVTVFILDTGIEFAHPEFGGRARQGVEIWRENFPTGDCNGHGTGVASVVGGSTYGVAKAVNLVSVKVARCIDGRLSTGTLSGGLDWVTGMVRSNASLRPAIVNVSVIDQTSAAIDLAASSAIAEGVVIVAGAGNASVDACEWSPGRVPEVITVASSDRFDRRAFDSGWGSCVDLYAPGVDIRVARRAQNGDGGGETVMSGTSFATPHVTGFVAQYLQAHWPFTTPATIHQEAISRATPGVIVNNIGETPNRLLYVNLPPRRRGCCAF